MRSASTIRSPLEEAKLAVPPCPPWVVARPRLIRSVARALDDGLVVSVFAAAGFGKTTLAAQNAQAWAGKVAWVSLDPGDHGLRRLWNLILAAALDEPVANHELDDARSHALQVFQELESPLLVIDDAHRLEPEALDHLARTAERTGSIVQYLLVGRPIDHIPWQRLRAAGGVYELDPEALGFTEAEIAQVCPDGSLDSTGSAPAPGWPAIVGLIQARPADEGTRLRAAVGDYISREVLWSLDAATIALILRASLLERWSPEIIAAVGERSTADVVDRLRSLVPLVGPYGEGAWWRIDPLLRAYLREQASTRLPPDERADCLRAAAPSLLAEGAFDDAFDALVRAGDHEAAAELLTNHVSAFETERRQPDLRQRFELLPRSIRLDPNLAIGFGWSLLGTGGPAETLEWCRRVEQLHQLPSEGAMALDVLRSFAHRTDFDHDASWAAADEVLARSPDPTTAAEAALAAMATVQQLEVGLWRGWFEELRPRFGDLRSLLDRGGYRLSRAKSAGQCALAYASAGYMSDAEFWIEQSHRVAVATGLLGTFVDVEHDLARTFVILEGGDIAKAESILIEVLERCRGERFNYPTTLVSAALELGRIGLVDRPDEALTAVMSMRFDRWRHDRYLAARLETFSAEHAARVGDSRAANASIDHYLALGVHHPDSGLRLARVALELGDVDRAQLVLTSPAVARAAGPRCALGRALLGARCGEDAELEAALVLASTVGLRREVVVNAGPLLDDLLAGDWPGVPPTYLRNLSAMAANLAPVDDMLAVLSGREREILPVLVTRATIPEIAEQLYISENTLKSHLRSIYRKLGVNSRREAAELAETHGVLPRT